MTKLEITDKDFSGVDDVVQTLESFNTSDINDQSVNQHNLQVIKLFLFIWLPEIVKSTVCQIILNKS